MLHLSARRLIIAFFSQKRNDTSFLKNAFILISNLSAPSYIRLSLYRPLKNIAYRAITVISIALHLISSVSLFVLGNSIPNVLTRISEGSPDSFETWEINENARGTNSMEDGLFAGRYRASPSQEAVSLTGCESITRPLTGAEQFYVEKRKRKEKRSLIFIVAIMDFIICFEELKEGEEG